MEGNGKTSFSSLFCPSSPIFLSCFLSAVRERRAVCASFPMLRCIYLDQFLLSLSLSVLFPVPSYPFPRSLRLGEHKKQNYLSTRESREMWIFCEWHFFQVSKVPPSWGVFPFPQVKAIRRSQEEAISEFLAWNPLSLIWRIAPRTETNAKSFKESLSIARLNCRW